MSLIEANDATLYYERRGLGPTVLFISGATGDAGHWTEVANILADESTVVTYDRRANSRSPRPPGWDSTTIDEQADDAAALLTGLQLAPAVVFGTSAGGGILANLCVRHPELLSGAVFHERYFQSGVSHPDVVRAWRTALIERDMAMGGPRAATELFLRSVAGDETLRANGCGPARAPTQQRRCPFRHRDDDIPFIRTHPPAGDRGDRDPLRCHSRRRQPRRIRPGPLALRGGTMARRPSRRAGCRTTRGTHALPGTTPRLRPRAPAASPLTRELNRSDSRPSRIESSLSVVRARIVAPAGDRHRDADHVAESTDEDAAGPKLRPARVA